MINKKDKKPLLKILPIFLISLIFILSINLIGSGSFDENDNREIGYEFLDLEGNITNASAGEVVHIWNNASISNYYFEKDSGIQLTNHFEDYWTKNVFCIGFYNASGWNKIACADELINFEKSIETDNETYVNATLWKDITYGKYDLRLGVQYHLGLNDENLSITIYGKNIGRDIPFDLGFAWKVKDINVPPETTDKIFINDVSYGLDGIYDLTFKNMTRKDVSNTTWNETCLEGCEMFGAECRSFCIINQTYDYEPLPFYKIYDRESGLLGEENFLRVDWNENLNYAIKMYGNGNQEDFYIALLIDAGHFNPNQEKSTTFHWIDAVNTDNLLAYYKLDESSGDVLDAHNSYDGTKIGGTAGQSGLINTAYTFIQNEKAIDLPSSMVNTANDFSMSCWIYTDGVTGTGNIWEYDNNDAPEIKMMILSGNTIRWQGYSGGSSQFSMTSGEAIPTGEWVHIVGTYETNSAKFYINGVFQEEDTSCSLTGTTATNHGLAYSDRFDATGVGGSVDEFAIFTEVLDQASVTDLYNGGNGLAYPFAAPEYNLTITDPTTASPKSVSSGDNITITYNFLEDGANITSGIIVKNITIGDLEASILTDSVCEGTLDCTQYSTEGTCNNCSECTWGEVVKVIEYATWENDWEGWTDGGTDAYLSIEQSNCGSYSIKLSDDSGDGYTQKALDFSGYSSVDVNFSLYVQGNVDDGECIFLTCDGNAITDWGSSGCSVNVAGEDDWYDVSAIIGSGDCDFETSPVIRIQSDSSQSAEDFFIDCMNISSIGTSCSNDGACSSCILGECDTNCSTAGCSIGTTNQTWYKAGTGWRTNVTVPTFASGLKDLFINASDGTNFAWDTNISAINYSAAVGDTCTYSSGNWEVNCNDNCSITSNVDLTGNTLIISGGDGSFEVLANITMDELMTPKGVNCELINIPNDGNELRIKHN